MTSTVVRPDIMPMAVEPTAIDGLLRITPKAVTDDRGTVREFFRTSASATPVPVPQSWRQVNLTFTKRGAIRGMHGEAADKLIGIADGTAFGAWVDARRGSATRGLVVRAAGAGRTDVRAGRCLQRFPSDVRRRVSILVLLRHRMAALDGRGRSEPARPGAAIDWPIPEPSDPSFVSVKDAAAPRFAEL